MNVQGILSLLLIGFVTNLTLWGMVIRGSFQFKFGFVFDIKGQISKAHPLPLNCSLEKFLKNHQFWQHS